MIGSEAENFSTDQYALFLISNRHQIEKLLSIYPIIVPGQLKAGQTVDLSNVYEASVHKICVIFFDHDKHVLIQHG